MTGYQRDDEPDKRPPLVQVEYRLAPITEKAPWMRYANTEPRNKIEAWLRENWFDLTGKRLP
jgi:hypothetical protein